jgi:hypothetical protein
MRSERHQIPSDISILIQEAMTPFSSKPGDSASSSSSGLLLENDMFNRPGNWKTSPSYPFFEADANDDAALSPLPLPISFSDQARYSPEVTEKEYISSNFSEPSEIPRKRNEKTSKLNMALNVLESLQAHHITLTELLTTIVSDPEFITYRYALFSEKNRSPLQNLFSLILKDEKGSHIIQEWMKPYAVQQVCEVIHKEMDAAKPHLQMSIKDITPEFISNWDVNKILEPIGQNITPTFCKILDAATETTASKMKQKSPKSRNRITVSPSILFKAQPNKLID